MKIAHLVLATLVAISACLAIGVKKMDLPLSVSDPAYQIKLDETLTGDLPSTWHHEATVGTSHFVYLGEMSGSSSMLHLAFDLSLYDVNRTVEGVCSHVASLRAAIIRGNLPRNISGYEAIHHPILTIYRLLEKECEEFRLLVRHSKNAFINRFGMDIDEARIFDKQVDRLRVQSQSQGSLLRSLRPKRQLGVLFLIGMGIVAVGSYLFSAHQLAAISIATGADKTTVK